MRITRKELENQAAQAGLYVAAYSPGDGVTRYRFFLTPRSYSQSDGLFTALGTRGGRRESRRVGVGASC